MHAILIIINQMCYQSPYTESCNLRMGYCNDLKFLTLEPIRLCRTDGMINVLYCYLNFKFLYITKTLIPYYFVFALNNTYSRQ